MTEILETLNALNLGENTAMAWIQAAAVFVGLNVLLKLVQVIVLRRLKKLADLTKNDFDDVLIAVLSRVGAPFYVLVSLFFAAQMLSLPTLISSVIRIAFVFTILFEAVRALGRVVDYLIEKYVEREAENGNGQHGQTMANAARLVIKTSLWIVAVAAALSNLGVNVTSIVASLGIGGIAIALAVQNVLGDVFSSFSIYLDKPFQIGDFITVGTDSGMVEKIGIKSTRIRTLQGEQLVVSNRELTTVRIQNFKRMERRRASFKVGVTYGTPSEKLRKIPGIVEEAIERQKTLDYDRCFLTEFGDSALIFEIVFYVNSPEYAEYLAALQEVNLELYDRFGELGIDFAFPTQTVYVEHDGSAPTEAKKQKAAA